MINIFSFFAVLANIVLVIYSDTIESDEESSASYYSESSASSSSFSDSSIVKYSSTFNGQDSHDIENYQATATPLELSPVCGPDEVEDGCINGKCGRQNCSQLGEPQLCIDLIAGYCKKGCRCKDNYLRDANGICVPITQCPIPECAKNQVFDFCPAYCLPDCDVDESLILCQESPKLGDQECNPSCRCADNFYRTRDGTCVPKSECNASKCNKLTEVYEECPDSCARETCESIWSRYRCDPNPEPCKPACRCKPDTYRNKNNECITRDECSMCTGPNEYFSCGGECDNECDKLSRQNQTICPLVNIQCNKKCYCEEGYARDINKNCIPIAECPPECKENERYVNNTNELCRAQTCAELGFNLACFQEGYDNSGQPGCVCVEGFIKNNEGICIPVEDCPSCGGDENATEGCGTFCTTCSNYKQKDQIACILSCQLNGCACRENYVFDENIKKCVLPESCTPQCKINEVFVNNTRAVCRAKKCSELGFPLKCLQPDYDSTGKPGCICKKGYVRDKSGVCIEDTKCPSCGGDVNAITGCGTFCKTCTNYKKGPIACPAICELNGCECKKNHIYDREIKKCVLPQNCNKSPDTVNNNWRDDFDQANNNFTAAFLFTKINEQPNKSVVTSPFSVLFILAQLALPAKGKSYQQIADIVNIKSKNEIRSIVPKYLDDISSQQNVTIELAEKVYGNIKFPFNKSFKRDTELIFHAEAENLDFDYPVQAANSINAWIASKTNNLIKDLISSTSLSQDTRLVLTNAIYFKGDWKIPFNVKKTQLKDFYVNNNNKVSVKMMNQVNNFNYGNLDDINAKVIQLFYKSSNFSYVAVLPNDQQDVLTLARKFKRSDFNFVRDVLNNLKSTKVVVTIPVIDTETLTDLADILKKNGITSIFDPNSSDLSEIMEQKQNVYVSSAIQKAKIIVNESGSQAAAANALIVGTTAVLHEAKPEEFNANHPFIYYIMFKKTPIFAGLYSGPQ